MKLQEERVFKISIDDIRELLKKQYNVDLSGIEPYIDENNLVFCMVINNGIKEDHVIPPPSQKIINNSPKPRRQKRRRNRIKTRGWKVLAKIQNSEGLIANIYEPMVLGLEGKEISRDEKKKIVRQIMLKNRNNPTEESVDYYLKNTLEYLEQQQRKGGESK